MANPFQALEVKLSAGTPIEEILKAAALIIEPIEKFMQIDRETMSQGNRDRDDLLRILLKENLCISLGFVRAEQLNRPITITGVEPKP